MYHSGDLLDEGGVIILYDLENSRIGREVALLLFWWELSAFYGWFLFYFIFFIIYIWGKLSSAI